MVWQWANSWNGNIASIGAENLKVKPRSCKVISRSLQCPCRFAIIMEVMDSDMHYIAWCMFFSVHRLYLLVRRRPGFYAVTHVCLFSCNNLMTLKVLDDLGKCNWPIAVQGSVYILDIMMAALQCTIVAAGGSRISTVQFLEMFTCLHRNRLICDIIKEGTPAHLVLESLILEVKWSASLKTGFNYKSRLNSGIRHCTGR